MKSLYSFFFFVSLSGSVLAQNSITLDQNNVRANLQDNGVLFQNSQNSSAGYEFPKDSNTYVMYSMGLWIMAIDQDSVIHGSASSFMGDLRRGPIANDYNSSYYTSNFDSCLWKVTKAEVDYHLANWINVGYTPSSNLANWPGNGNTAEGIAQDLAPYVDHNNDGIYNPLDGDYPDIRGDEAVYIIMNDEAVPLDGPQTSARNLGLEVHLMLYQFNSTDPAVNNTTFMNTKLYNRSDTAYTDLILTIWSDPDIGNYANDFVGCDSLKNLGFAFNGESTDAGGGGQNPFGTNPPALGIKFLNEPMTSFISAGSSAGLPSSIYNLMQGLQANSAPFLDNMGSPTTYHYPTNPNNSSGWSEPFNGNPPGDRKFIMSSAKHAFGIGADLCFDAAILVDNDGMDYLANVNELYGTADHIQSYYNSYVNHCWYANPTVSQKEIESAEINIYPNPSSGSLAIETAEAGTLMVYNLEGKLIQYEVLAIGTNAIELDASPGVYILQMQFGSEMIAKKLVIR